MRKVNTINKPCSIAHFLALHVPASNASVATLAILLVGDLPKPGGASGQIVPKLSCCVTAPIGSAPYFRPQKCGTYMPKSGARNDIIYPTPKSRLGALAPQWVRTQKANRCTPDFKRSTQSPRPCPIMGKGAALKDIPYFGTTCLRRINFKAKEKCRTQPQGLSPTLFLTVPV